MLSNNVPATPRPRPPAQLRRSSSSRYKESPPPPYAAPAFPFPSPRDRDSPIPETPMDTILGSSISMTAQRVRLLSGGSPPGSHTSLEAVDWMQEKSREELSDLLSRADKTIRDRENDLGLTSTVCKNLYQENINLKNKHEALLARLPSSPVISPGGSPPGTVTPLVQSPHFYSASLPHSNFGSLSLGTPSAPTPQMNRHTRRISVTPGEISRLADQNHELMIKLEKLESESTQADQVGKKKLRKLEKEIQLLRDELERTQVRSEELEERAKASFAKAITEEEMERKKKEREEKARAMRGKGADDEDEDDEIRDFAPGGALSSPQTSPTIRRFKFPTTPRTTTPPFTFPTRGQSSPCATPTSNEGQGDLFSPSFIPRSQQTPGKLHESAIIPQLLLKIRELEETNVQISEQQKQAAEKMRSAQQDVDSIRRLYECLGEDVEVQIVTDDISDDLNRDFMGLNLATRDKTIRFRSLKRTIEGDVAFMVDEEDNSFDGGIEGGMHSTTRGPLVMAAPQHKARKSVVGLFDPDTSMSSQGSRSGSSTASVSTSAFQPMVKPSPQEPVAWPTTKSRTPSPTPSTYVNLPPSDLRFSPAPSLRVGAEKHTLGSELGSEYGDDWGVDNEHHHLRTASLYDMSHMVETASSRAPSPPPPRDVEATPRASEWNSRQKTWANPPSALQLSLREDTAGASTSTQRGSSPQPLPALDKIRREAMYTRNRRLSQTVQARTTRWVDGRFKDTLRPMANPEARPPTEERKGPGRSTLRTSVTKMFEGVVGSVSGREHSSSEKNIQAMESQPRPVVRAESKALQKVEDEKTGVVAVVLDLWLWLQFIIIIMVFLWAMAKRGPRNVLEEAERRRAARPT
ncbi:hypothetical protein JAAARDRAFT_52162 [Jaapia argillacea MUCL 33604]|uniref:Uncharacterized protein n=1 Tax=Jaapia argillacea MUCL 33604 TaxID=933084 RepID=A0A067QDC0_9AGAM|nr:hypothetical protein JAAARDRAFT_52162 [Jaapia argillacea MUCL 33604]